MKELVIISGKGGTGKTSVAAAFAALASRKSRAVFADCDVDAADLHLVLSPDIVTRSDFFSGHEAKIDPVACVRCGKCAEFCRFDAAHLDRTGAYDIVGCEGCGVCVHFCPVKAISFPDRLCGEWYLSETRFGPLIHARLDAGAENSGKLVSLVRKEAWKKAEEVEAELIIVDGCPGIGCPVIASITGADAVLAVVEPSLSSKHDLERVIELTKHFKVPLFVAVNKYDINPEIAGDIEGLCASSGVVVAGRIGYDTAVTDAQVQGESIIEYGASSEVAKQIESIWSFLEGVWKRSK